MQLFHTSIIPSEYDQHWAAAELPDDKEGIELLIITGPFQSGSEEAIVLEKMIKACRLSDTNYFVQVLEDREIISLARYCRGKIPRFVLMLGITPRQLGITAEFAFSAPNSFLQSCFFPTAPLAQVAYDSNLKRSLWEQGLKPIFG